MYLNRLETLLVIENSPRRLYSTENTSIVNFTT